MPEEEADENAPFGATDDHPSAEDQLGFGPYVSAVKYFLTHEETTAPLTLSIEGEWGSGKSSFMKQLRKDLEEEGKTTVEFNPWRHEGQEALWASFAITLVNSLKQSASLTQRPTRYTEITGRRLLSETSNASLIKLASVFILTVIGVCISLYIWIEIGIDWIISVFSTNDMGLRFWLGTSGVIVGAVAVADLGRRAYDVWTTSINKSFEQQFDNSSYRERTEFLESFQSDLERILDVYAPGEPVYVFMDDLDRCTVPRAADLMRSINLMVSDDSNVVFVLGLDRARVAAGITAKHDEILDYLEDEPDNDDSIDFGYRYLEKFIQIPFVVPEPKGEDIQRLVREDVLDADVDAEQTNEEDIESLWERDLAPRFETTLDDIVEMAAPALGNNPRQVKRFLNLYRLRAVIAESEGLLAGVGDNPVGDMITLPQLAKFVVISIRWPSFVTTVANDPTALNRVSGYANGEEYNIEEYDVLKSWADTDALLELLAHGAGKRYRMENVSIVDLKRISPRVDRPARSDQEEMEYRVQIAFFDEASYDPDTIQTELRAVSDALDIDLQLSVFHDAKQKPVAEVSELYHSFIWIVDPSLLAKTWFQRLCENAPEQLQIISLNPQTEFIDSPISRSVWAVDSLEGLTEVLEEQLKTIDAINESGETQWEEWQRSLAELRDMDDTEILD
ncbi:KAP family P-loop NTPase fold protein [Halolamina rubra]|uniref:KAP family P-loop NTPase fold protein n=1 Tax=Halolamina rubra TaxID=1380430 RepID=UPI0009E55AA5|nr:P-loop NTPase fold protein [Halolamina rubra]